MNPSRRFRALSLDLWSTTVIERPGPYGPLDPARFRFLQDSLGTPGRGPVPSEDLDRAIRETHEVLRTRGVDAIEVDPADLVRRYVDALGTRPAQSFAEIGRTYSAVGLLDDPPEVNPQARTLVAKLDALGVPVVAISDTARREESWQAFFRARGGIGFRYIVTSCEVGHAKPHPAIFREAARRLGLAPEVILHVGDRWDRDARGALDARFGAVLYTGLWDRRPPEEHPVLGREDAERAGVPCLDRLDDPQLLRWLE